MGSMPTSCPTAPSCRPATTSRDAHPTTTAARCLRFIWVLRSFAALALTTRSDGAHGPASDKDCHPVRWPTMSLPVASLSATRSGSYNAVSPSLQWIQRVLAHCRNPNTSRREDRLDSWKEIAVYLNRSVRTLHRWEKDEGLPVHRHQHKELGSVFAYKASSTPGSAREARIPTFQVRSDQPASAPRSA